MKEFQEATVIFYDTVGAIEYKSPDIEKPDYINFFCNPLSEHKGLELTNMEQGGTFKNIFDIEEIRCDYEIGGLSAVALTYIELFFGCTRWCTIPLTLLKTPFNFNGRLLRITPGQNFSVRLTLPKGVRSVRYCSIGLKGIYHYPIA